MDDISGVTAGLRYLGVSRALLTKQLVFGLDFVETGQLIHQTHGGLLFRVCHVRFFKAHITEKITLVEEMHCSHDML